MITPRFSLSQDETFLYINIRAPYCSLRDLEVYAEENDFRFICSPYYLRLNLPGKILDNDASSGKFDSDKGEFTFKYAKENKSEFFQGLDFITSLLKPIKSKTKPHGIEVLKSENDDSNNDDEWFIEQKLPMHDSDIKLFNCGYGFASQKYNILKNTEDEFYSVFEIRSADTTNNTERKNQKFDSEALNFSGDHYLADLYDCDEIKDIISKKPPWAELQKDSVAFTEEERDTLKDFPNREYLLSKNEIKFVYYGLVDILYAYCYDRRTTYNEGTCESGWTITKISATLSWFHVFENENEVIKSSYRRCLVYPLYRNVELCKTVLDDLKTLLNLGEIYIVKCLIDIYNIFNASADPRYILNDLYIKDYIIYLQKCDRDALEEVIANVNNDIQVTEEDLQLNLDFLKTKSQNSLHDRLLNKMESLNITSSSDDSDDSDSSCDSSSESDDDSDDLE